VQQQRNVDFPESAAKLGEILWQSVILSLDFLVCSPFHRRAIEAGLDLPDTFRDEFLTKEVGMIFNRIKVTLHVAGTISPLAILIPTLWSNYHIGREHLLTVCCNLHSLSLTEPDAGFVCTGQ
jgi:hypothetical protein